MATAEEIRHAEDDKRRVDILVDVFEKNPGAWTKGVSAKDSKGRSVDPHADDVCQVCLTGGIDRISKDRAQYNRILKHVHNFIPKKFSGHAVDFNDDKKTTVDDITAALKATSTHLKHINGH